MVASGFLPQNFGRWWGPTNCCFCSKRNAALVVLTMLGGRDTQTLLDSKKIWTLCTHRCTPIFPSSWTLALVLSLVLVLALALAQHVSHLVKFHHLIFSIYLMCSHPGFATKSSVHVCILLLFYPFLFSLHFPSDSSDVVTQMSARIAGLELQW